MPSKKITKKQASEKKDSDIIILTRKIEKLKKHLEKNKHDYKTKRSMIITEAKLYKLKKIESKKKG